MSCDQAMNEKLRKMLEATREKYGILTKGFIEGADWHTYDELVIGDYSFIGEALKVVKAHITDALDGASRELMLYIQQNLDPNAWAKLGLSVPYRWVKGAEDEREVEPYKVRLKLDGGERLIIAEAKQGGLPILIYKSASGYLWGYADSYERITSIPAHKTPQLGASAREWMAENVKFMENGGGCLSHGPYGIGCDDICNAIAAKRDTLCGGDAVRPIRLTIFREVLAAQSPEPRFLFPDDLPQDVVDGWEWWPKQGQDAPRRCPSTKLHDCEGADCDRFCRVMFPDIKNKTGTILNWGEGCPCHTDGYKGHVATHVTEVLSRQKPQESEFPYAAIQVTPISTLFGYAYKITGRMNDFPPATLAVDKKYYPHASSTIKSDMVKIANPKRALDILMECTGQMSADEFKAGVVKYLEGWLRDSKGIARGAMTPAELKHKYQAECNILLCVQNHIQNMPTDRDRK